MENKQIIKSNGDGTNQQNQEGDNINAGIVVQSNNGVLNIAAQQEKEDFSILENIYISIFDQGIPEEIYEDGYLELGAKIKLNFSTTEDRDTVSDYFKYAYPKILAVESWIVVAGRDKENDLRGFILNKYRLLKVQDISSYKILEDLFSQFKIPEKKHDLAYDQMARALVLFFFEDCTIFKKTGQEKMRQERLSIFN